MRSNTSSPTDRRTRRLAARRARRRPAILATGLAFGIFGAAVFATTSPATHAEASDSLPSIALVSFSTPLQPAAGVTSVAMDHPSTGADEALAAADAVLAAAAAVAADIGASGLDIGVPDTSIDTTPLESAVVQLEGAHLLPAPLVPALAGDVTALVASIEERVGDLRGSLDAAQERKAEEEAAAAAAEQARLEAEATAARAKAAASASVSTPTGAAAPAAPPTGPVTGGNSPAEAQATARAMLASRGWGDDQFGCLVSLWHKESGWRVEAYNRSSGATGIPQALPGNKMASAGADWQTSASTQIAWGLGYIGARYGTPCGAWAKSQSSGWY